MKKERSALKNKIMHSIVIPAYNEAEGLPVVLKKIQKVVDDSFEILVVDDGSTDGTAETAKKCSCRLISHDVNQGKGAAMKTGIKNARGENVIFIDADDTYPVETIVEIAVSLGEYDYVVASRSRGKQNIPAFNRIGNAIFRNSIRYIYRFKAYDPLTGLYGLKKTHLEKMDLRSKGFGIESEIAIKAASMGLKIKDIPIVYKDRIGKAKLNGLRDGYRIARTIIRHLPLYNPTVTFILPGLLLFLAGLAGMISFLSGSSQYSSPSILPGLLSALLVLTGFQIGTFGLASKIYAVAHKHCRADLFSRFFLRKGMRWKLTGIGLLMVFASLVIGRMIFFENVSLGEVSFLESARASGPLASSLVFDYKLIRIGGDPGAMLLLLTINAVFGMLIIFTASFLSVFTAGLPKR